MGGGSGFALGYEERGGGDGEHDIAKAHLSNIAVALAPDMVSSLPK